MAPADGGITRDSGIPDVSPGRGDAGPAPDAATLDSGAQTIETDAAAVESDAAPLETDAAAVESDAAPGDRDASPVAPDARLVEPDAEPVARDAEPVLPDAAPVEPDAAFPEPDAAFPEPDAAFPEPDAAFPEPDAAFPAPDAVAPDPDAASPDPDAAPPEPDASGPPAQPFAERRDITGGQDATAVVLVHPTVINAAPPNFGANLAYDLGNNWTIDPTMEGQILRWRDRATGGDARNILNEVGGTTRFYDSVDDGFFDGATARVYRVDPDDGVSLVRTGTVARYLAGGYTRLNRGVPVTGRRYLDTAQNLQNGRTYYYVVRAIHPSGTPSADSAEVEATPGADLDPPPVVEQTDYQGPIAGEPVEPAPPVAVRATPHDAGVLLEWDLAGGPEVVGYEIWRARTPGETHERRIELSADGPPVEAGDIYHLDLVLPNPRLDAVSDRLSWIPTQDPWSVFGPGVGTRDPTTHAPIDGGASSLRLSTESEEEVSIRQYRYGHPDSSYRHLEPGRTYRFAAWLKQEDIPDGRVEFRFNSNYRDVATVFEVSDAWQLFEWEFEAPPMPPPRQPIIQHIIAFTGPGTLWVDNAWIYEADRPVLDLDPRGVEALRRFEAGSLRIWSGQTNGSWGQTLDNWTDPPTANRTTWTTNNGKRASDTLKLPTALALCADTGTDPWLIVGPYMDESEWLGLIEYLAGPPDSPWGRKRALSGREAPWTDAFGQIRLELGNETWNPLFSPWTYANGREFGAFAAWFYDVARSSPFFDPDAFVFTLGGWAIQTTDEGYGAAARQVAEADEVTIAGYIGGWEAGFQAGGDAMTDEGFETILTFVPRQLQEETTAHAITRDALTARGFPYALGVYEAGPGYDLPNPGTPFNPVQEEYGKSLAAGVANLDAFLLRAALGYGMQNFFLFQPGYNWTSHTLETAGFRPHPSWLALEMRNTLVSGDMVATQRLDTPTVDLDRQGALDAVDGLPQLASYAFRDGDTWSVFLLSRRLEQATPVELHLPSASMVPTGAWGLEGDPRENNLDEDRVVITELPPPEAPAAGAPLRLDMPPGSVRLYRFEASAQPLPDRPWVTVNQAPGQADPTPRPFAAFEVWFSEPVETLPQESIVVEGDTDGRVRAVTPIATSGGMAFEVVVDDFADIGETRVRIPAGATRALDDSRRPATSSSPRRPSTPTRARFRIRPSYRGQTAGSAGAAPGLLRTIARTATRMAIASSGTCR
jgi:hypothetical protein